MNLSSIRIRLTLLFTLLAALTIGPFAVYSASQASSVARQQARAAVQEQVTRVLGAADRSQAGVDNAWIVRVSDTSSLAVGDTNVEPPLQSVAKRAERPGAEVFDQFSQGSREFLVHGESVGDETVIVAAVDLAPFADRETASRLKIAMAALAMIALAASVSWWLVGRSLRPARVALDNQRDFVADAAHEMRTPLAVIQASASHALHRDREPGEYRVALDEIRTAATRATAGVGELLELARLDAGQAQPRRAPLRVDLMVEEVAASVIVEGVAVTAGSNEAPLVVSADYLLLRQAVENVVRNAAARGDAVAVEARDDGDHVSIAVVDNGPGFDPSALPTVFERFRRGDSKGGAGLGLAIARSIVELHEGTIAASNEPEGGARVEIRLRSDR